MADKYVKIFLLLRYKLFVIKLYLVYYLHFISLYLLILLSLFITVLSYFQYICLIEMFQKLGEVSPVSREQDGIQKRFYISVCVLIYWKLKLVLGHVYKELLSYIISCNIERWKIVVWTTACTSTPITRNYFETSALLQKFAARNKYLRNHMR